jgi:hypothetical protein
MPWFGAQEVFRSEPRTWHQVVNKDQLTKGAVVKTGPSLCDVAMCKNRASENKNKSVYVSQKGGQKV